MEPIDRIRRAITENPVYKVLDRTRMTAEAIGVMGKAGMLRPKVAVSSFKAAAKWGATPAGGLVASAERAPSAIGVIDDWGSLTYAELDLMTNRLANALIDRGVTAGTPVGLYCRNSRWFIISAAALSKTGATVLYMNTGFAGPQLADVMRREGGTVIIHDAEFTESVITHAPDLVRLVADGPDPLGGGAEDLPSVIVGASPTDPPKPSQSPKQVILTSGTTGVPKGASRDSVSADVVAATSVFERVPFHYGDVHVVAAPMFHSLGAAAALMGGSLTQTAVMTRRFDAERVLRLISDHKARVLTAVPVMLQRMLEVPDKVHNELDFSSLEIVFCSGSALPGSLAIQWMDRFGDNLYNMYGSTEVAAATIATPEDLRAAPGTAGKPLNGVDVRLYDEGDQVVTEPGRDGRIFVGSSLRFDGYTGGQTKPSIDGLLSSGDMGQWDDEGRLFVGGRDDDMIVSGGENLYPREVEDLLADHDAINEVAVIGVDDEEFGKRLAAFVVLEDGAKLDEGGVKAYVKANLANFKVPRDVTFIDELPRNATGKVLKKDLRALNG